MGNTKSIIRTVPTEPTDNSLQEGEKVLYNNNEYQKRGGKAIRLDVGAGVVGEEKVSQPSIANGSFRIWMASSGGTKDSTVYEEDDVLLTVVDDLGTSKTIILADFSAL